MKAVLTSLCILLTGCSAGYLKSHSNSFVADTQKTPLNYIQCLEPKWQVLNTTTSAVRSKTGYTLNVSEYHIGQIALAVITEQSTGAHIEVFLPAALGNPQRWKDSAGACL
ncbi:hypothetical protein ACTJK3_04820 [Pseudomonas sp. 22105]|uniref:hypothetical protein n=1 Tax=unclassified Pseudomonas TaxID=196821 RepID=UPI003F87A514